jgi:hypothetical protein
MFARGLVAFALLSTPIGCGGGAAPPSEAPPATTAAPTAQNTSAAAAPSATTVAEPAQTSRPDAAAGTERLAFDLKVWGKDGGTVRATVDVPARYAILVEDDGPHVATCRAATSLGTEEMRSFWLSMRGVGLSAKACDKTPKECFDAFVGSEADGPDAKVERTDDRVVIRRAPKGKDGQPRIDDSVVLYDKASKTTVRCAYSLPSESAKYRDEYAAVCATLAVDASATTKKAASRPGSLTDAERIDLDGAPHKEKLQATVTGFAAAMGKRDFAAAEKFLLSPSDCAKLTKDPKQVAGCAAETRTAAAALPDVATVYPEKFEAGAMRLARGEGLVKSVDKAAEQKMFEVLVSPKGGDCTYESFLFVGLVGDDYRVFLGMKKAEKKGEKPAKAPAKKK